MTSSEPVVLSIPAVSFAYTVRQHGWWLIAAFVFASPIGKGFEVPLALMTFGSIALMFKDGRTILRHTSIRWLLPWGRIFPD
ncbi:hypothetical protein [Sulfuriferula sp.]|uniref:hypothetical protein n=1 Tax=Sulfuriferula sp. TaxID=2025307 RepID=UPI0027318C85|nr:hypothetical protein [Sulfuriferula sp.]MDP2026117.1 hypothetical protein [Sulfuriferula sp.]